MYRVTCDGFPLLDWRDNALLLTDPKVSLEVNTVGEGSFTIYKNHPHFDKLQKMKSVVEVADETGVIFRGRATGDTVDFEHGANVDLEGAMAFFNDSLVRPFNFPGDFKEDPDYLTADASGERVAFFLGWLIDTHNSQVQDFQQLKLGNVTVRDPDLARSSDQYASTWAMIKAKLFTSSLGGYLCIRYEEDGNYIDYLSEFTETNSQEIRFGENLLDLRNATEASGIYTAIVPFGALGLTLTGLDDGDITDDIVKSGDTLYSRQAVDQFGWIYAPTESTTWEEVVDDAELLKVGVEWLAKGGAFLNAIEVTAVDLHFTDAQIESLRLYKNVKVHSEPHGLAESFPLSRLEIDLLHSQNTKITVGKTLATYTEQAALLQEEAKKNYSKLSKTDEAIKAEVYKEITTLTDGFTETLKSYSTSEQTAEAISTAVSQSEATINGRFESYSTTEQTAEAISTAVSKSEETINGKFESYSTREQTAESISAAVEGLVDGEQVSSSIEAALGNVTLQASSAAGSTTLQLLSGGTILDTQTLNVTVDAAYIHGPIYAASLHLSGLLSIYSGKYEWDSQGQDLIESIGGYIGYDSGFYGNAAGIGMRSANEYSEMVCTEWAARMSYSDDFGSKITQVVCGQELALSSVSSIQFSIGGNVMDVVAGLDATSFYPADLAMTLGTALNQWADVHAAGTSMSDLLERVKTLEDAAKS